MKTYYRIHFDVAPHRGFFSFFSSAIGFLYEIKQQHPDWIPFIQSVDRNNPYYQDSGEGAVGNMWEQYYEQLRGLSMAQINKEISEGAAKLEVCAGGHCWYPANEEEIKDEVIDICLEIIDSEFKLKPFLENEINSFFNSFIKNQKTLAVHYRGTDKEIERKRPTWESYKNIITDCINNKGYEKVLVCTDEQAALDYFKSEFKDRIIEVPSIYRSAKNDRQPPWKRGRGANPAKKGKDIILETYIMSKCDGFIRTISNVSDFVVILNRREFDDVILVK